MEGTGVVELPIGRAVDQGIVNNETLGYFLVRVHKFLIKVGANPQKVRFRQHLLNEMAHYACDCWDAEIHTSYGWIECVGNADRAGYDLAFHQRASGKSLTALIPFPDGPKDMEMLTIEVNKGGIGTKLRGQAKQVLQYLEEIKDKPAAVKQLQDSVAQNAEVKIADVLVPSEYFKFTPQNKKISGRTVQPSVIEPSFGLGRILYCLLEHGYSYREGDMQRGVLSLKPIVAPYKTSILPLVNDEKILAVVPRLVKLLTKNRISHKADTTGVSVGRRYARTDELGIPFGITVDFEGLPDDTVTLRERDSMQQVRIKIDAIPALLHSLIDETTSWAQVRNTYPNVEIKDQE